MNTQHYLATAKSAVMAALTNMPSTPKKLDPEPHYKTQTQRMFGYYECFKCHKKWISSHAWGGIGQKCMRCQSNVLPRNLQNVEPTYMFVYKCSNKSCAKLHTLQERTSIPQELSYVFMKEQTFLCTTVDGAMYSTKRPSRMTFHHQNVSCHVCCYAQCSHCLLPHTTNTLFVNNNHIASLSHICIVCNSSCDIHQISRIESNLSIPHRRELCKMCIKLKGYCGSYNK